MFAKELLMMDWMRVLVALCCVTLVRCGKALAVGVPVCVVEFVFLRIGWAIGRSEIGWKPIAGEIYFIAYTTVLLGGVVLFAVRRIMTMRRERREEEKLLVRVRENVWFQV